MDQVAGILKYQHATTLKLYLYAFMSVSSDLTKLVLCLNLICEDFQQKVKNDNIALTQIPALQHVVKFVGFVNLDVLIAS